jgi:hypothetical protein
MTLYAILATFVIGTICGSLATFKYLIYSGEKEMAEEAAARDFDKSVKETLKVVNGPILK